METEDVMHGDAIECGDSNIVFSGLVHFEKNEADRGGAIWLQGTSKLVLKPRLKISFISIMHNGVVEHCSLKTLNAH